MNIGGKLGPARLEAVTVVGIAAAAALTVTYVGLAGFNPDDPGIHDNREYFALWSGHGAEVQKPFHWRVLVPWLARMLPGGFEVGFGIVCIAALTVGGVALYWLLKRWGASGVLALLGVGLFFLSHTVLRFGGIPLVESAAFAVVIVGMLLAEMRRPALFGVLVLVGMFVKETTAILAVFVLVMSAPRRAKLALAGAMFPGLAAYAVVRLVIDPVALGYEYSPLAWVHNLAALFSPGGLGFWRGIALSFGVLWVFVALGLRRGGLVPRRYGWMIAACAALPLFLSTDYERVIFLAFPVGLAFALPPLARAVETGVGRGQRVLTGP